MLGKRLFNIINILLSFTVLWFSWPIEAFALSVSAPASAKYEDGIMGIWLKEGNPYLLIKGSRVGEEIERLFYQIYGLRDAEHQLWVNLKPGIGGRDLIGRQVGYTDVGKYLFDADLRLKEDAMRLVEKVLDDYGIDVDGKEIDLRFWIRSGEVGIKEYKDGMVINEAKLKVKVEVRGGVKSRVFKIKNLIERGVVPELEREVNEGKGYRKLREIYRLYIGSKWLKEKGIGNRWIEDGAYYYGRIGVKKWMMLDVMKRYLELYEGGDEGEIIGGVNLGEIEEVKKKTVKGTLGEVLQRGGEIIKKAVFNQKFVVFFVSLITLGIMTFGNMDLSWGANHRSVYTFKEYASKVEKGVRNYNKRVDDLWRKFLLSLKGNKRDIYKYLEKEFGVKITKGGKIEIQDLKGAFKLLIDPVYSRLFTYYLQRTDDLSVDGKIDMENVEWMLEFFRAYGDVIKDLPYFHSFINKIFNSSSMQEFWNEHLRTDDPVKGDWGPDDWKVRVLFDYFKCKKGEVFRSSFSELAKENGPLFKVMEEKYSHEKRDIYRLYVKQIFYYWMYASAIDETLWNTFLRIEDKKKDEIRRAIDQRGILSVMRDLIGKRFPAFWKLVEEKDPYANALVWAMMPEVLYGTGWDRDKIGDYMSLEPSSYEVLSNISRLSPVEMVDFVKFIWWYYVRIPKGYSFSNPYGQYFLSLGISLKAYMPLNTRTDIFSMALEVFRYRYKFYRKTDAYEMFNKVSGYDEESKIMNVYVGLYLSCLANSAKEWREAISKISNVNELNLEVLEKAKEIIQRLRRLYHNPSVSPYFYPKLDGYDVGTVFTDTIPYGLFCLQDLSNRGFVLDGDLWERVLFGRSRIVLPIKKLSLSEDFWNKNKDEIKDFFDFFAFRKALFRKDSLSLSDFSGFDLSALFTLYFSEEFQSAFKNIKDTRLRFALVSGVLSDLIDHGKYDLENDRFVFGEDDVKEAIERVKVGIEKMKSKTIAVSGGEYSLIVVRAPEDKDSVGRKYVQLLRPVSVSKPDSKKSVLKTISKAKGKLLLVIETHGKMKDRVYLKGKKPKAFSIVSPDGNDSISVEEMVSALEEYARNNNGDMSDLVIVAGNCFPGFWIEVLKELKEWDWIKNLPVVITHGFPTTVQVGLRRLEVEIEEGYGSTWIDIIVQRFIEKAQGAGEKNVSLYDFLKYTVNSKFPLIPMIYFGEKSTDASKGKFEIIILSTGLSPWFFPIGRRNETNGRIMELMRGLLEGFKNKEIDLTDLFEEFASNLEWQVNKLNEEVERQEIRDLFVEWLKKNKDKIKEEIKRLLERKMDSIMEIKDIDKELLKNLVEQIDSPRKVEDISEENDERVKEIAELFLLSPDTFMREVMGIIFGRTVGSIKETSSETTKKGGIEFGY